MTVCTGEWGNRCTYVCMTVCTDVGEMDICMHDNMYRCGGETDV